MWAITLEQVKEWAPVVSGYWGALTGTVSIGIAVVALRRTNAEKRPHFDLEVVHRSDGRYTARLTMVNPSPRAFAINRISIRSPRGLALEKMTSEYDVRTGQVANHFESVPALIGCWSVPSDARRALDLFFSTSPPLDRCSIAIRIVRNSRVRRHKTIVITSRTTL